MAEQNDPIHAMYVGRFVFRVRGRRPLKIRANVQSIMKHGVLYAIAWDNGRSNLFGGCKQEGVAQ